jgi:hypothetical protein
MNKEINILRKNVHKVGVIYKITELHFALTDTEKPGTSFVLHYVKKLYIHNLEVLHSLH